MGPPCLWYTRRVGNDRPAECCLPCVLLRLARRQRRSEREYCGLLWPIMLGLLSAVVVCHYTRPVLVVARVFR